MNKFSKQDLIKEEIDIEALINKGAPVKSDKPKETKVENKLAKKDELVKWKTMCLRIPSPLEKGMDNALKLRYSVTKTAWILEAIREKLERDLA